MARIGATIGVNSAALGSYSFTGAATVVDPLASSTLTALNATLVADQATLATDQGTFETALATLVADGASPTQAHVTAANSAYTTMKTDLATVTTDITNLRAAFGAAPGVSDVVISVDRTKVPSISALRAALGTITRMLSGTSFFTP